MPRLLSPLRRLLLCALLAALPALRPSAARPADTLHTTLTDVVALALAHSRTLENAYLDRQGQQYDLTVARARFYPQFSLSTSLQTGQERMQHVQQGTSELRADGLTYGAAVTNLLPTGARLRLAWNGDGNLQVVDVAPPGQPEAVHSRTVGYLQGAEVQVEQPLLRGAGWRVTRAPLRAAVLQDDLSQQQLRTTAAQTITAVILSYRALILARDQLTIAQSALDRARRTYELNERLVATGRMAQIDLVQSETEVANRELTLAMAHNEHEAAQLQLLALLDLDRDVALNPTDSLVAEPRALEVDALIETAFANRPDYRQARTALDLTRQNRTLARNEVLPEVNLFAARTLAYQDDLFNRSFGFGEAPFSEERGWRAGVNLRYTFGDRARRRHLAQSSLALQIAHNNLRDLEEAIRLEVRDRVRDAQLRLQQVDLARRARMLSEQKLEVEEAKLAIGRSSNFQVLTFQNDLITARVHEITAVAAYLNALTLLDQALGVTLQRWNVDLHP